MAKSRTQKFREMDGDIDIPDYKGLVKEESLMSIEKKMFPRTVAFKKLSKDGKVSVCDDSTMQIPNDPQYIGFGKSSIPSNRLTAIPEPIVRHFGSRCFFIGWQACAFLAEHNFIYKACSMPGEDALGCGYKVTPKTKNSKMMKAIDDIIDDKEFGLDESLLKFEFNKRCFGFGLAVPDFEEGIYDENNNPNGVRMDVPLKDYMQLQGKHFRGWAIIDPYWTTPAFDHEAERNPASKEYFRPTWWRVNGRGGYIHKSWCIHARNTMMADVASPTYLWGGISVPQLCYERVYSADKCANEAQMVAMSKRLVAVTGCNTRKMAANPEYGRRQMESFRLNRDNWGMIALGAGQDIKQIDTMLSEFNQLITTQYQLFCGIVEIPAPKMMMSPLTGFANSGDYEWKVYAAHQKKIQKYDYDPMLKMTYRILAACLGFDCKFDVEWGRIDIPTPIEQSKIFYEESRAEKFHAEAKALSRRSTEQANANPIAQETHKSVSERVGANGK